MHRSEEHTSELQSRGHLVCRLLLEKKTGVVTGFAWLPDGGSLVVIALEPRGTSTLSRLDLASDHATVVARDLDAPTLFSPVAVAPDGRRAYVALAGSGAPSPEARHEPPANRP